MKHDPAKQRTVFLFDLDGTLTTQETLPLIAERCGLGADINRLTAETVKGNLPFVESFIRRVDILKQVPVSRIANILRDVCISEQLVRFIREEKDNCYIVTGNLSCWVDGLLEEKIPCGYFASKGLVEGDQLVKITEILKKEEIVRHFKNQGARVVFVGDGNNDSQAMREADVSVACGHTHYPAQSVLSVADYVVFDECALVRLLAHILEPDKPGKTIVLSCAGIGSRLGTSQAKSLIKLNDTTVIEWQLRQFAEMSDIRIVVGFQAKEVMEMALGIRSDLIFAFNHDYFHTGTGASLYLGSRFAREYVVAWDGDLLVHPEDVKVCLATQEYIGCSRLFSSQPVWAKTDESGHVVSFSVESGDFEWSGPACLRSRRIDYVKDNVYNILSRILPMPVLEIRAVDIDTYEDYKRALKLATEWGIANDNKQ